MLKLFISSFFAFIMLSSGIKNLKIFKTFFIQKLKFSYQNYTSLSDLTSPFFDIFIFF